MKAATHYPQSYSEGEERRGPSLQVLLVMVAALAYAALMTYSASFTPLRIAKGTSMEPTLREGDLVVLKKVPFEALAPGDVIAYDTPAEARQGGAPRAVLHRVLREEVRDGRRVLVTKGDNSAVDPWTVVPETYQGKMVARVPLVGKPFVLLTGRQGIVFISITLLLSLLYIPAMVIFYVTVIKRPEEEETGPRPAEGDPTPPVEVRDLANKVENLTAEHQRITQSHLQLSQAIATYAVHLESHTKAIQELAEVTRLLRRSVELQVGQPSREEGGEASSGPAPPAVR